MKIAILTSDIHDGLIVTQKILRRGKDVRAVIYEKKKRTLRTALKRALIRMKGLIDHVDYGGILRRHKDVILREVDDMNSTAVVSLLREIAPDLITVIGTRKLDKEVLESAAKGAINMHSGILPYYRGADSEFWALYNGEKDRIGVTIHFMDEELDAGDIIIQARQEVSASDDHRSLRFRNILLGAEKMVEAIDKIESGGYTRTRQDTSLARTYRSATREDITRYRKSRRK